MYRLSQVNPSDELKSIDRIFNALILFLLISVIWVPAPVSADTLQSSPVQNISLQQISPGSNGGFGYRLVYYVPAPIGLFWRFKTDFSSEILLTNDELLAHRVVKTFGNSVITENRYATAPGLRFMWQTNVIAEQYRLEFKLLNAKDCRHDFHYGTIQLSPEADYTKVTQIAYFDFRGASLWVRYPWYGGMRSTLTKVAKWEQQMARDHVQTYFVDGGRPNKASHVRRKRAIDSGKIGELRRPAK
jgi:hypothetical protein